MGADLIIAFRTLARAIAKAQGATQRDFVLDGAHAPADARTPVSAATEAHGEAGEAQEG